MNSDLTNYYLSPVPGMNELLQAEKRNLDIDPDRNEPARPALTPERKDLLANIIVCAIEGGINYWAGVKEYDWRENADESLMEYARAVIIDEDESTGEEKELVVDFDLVEKGLKLAPAANLHKNYKGPIMLADANNDALEIDAETADFIVQLGLFGEVIYG